MHTIVFKFPGKITVTDWITPSVSWPVQYTVHITQYSWSHQDTSLLSQIRQRRRTIETRRWDWENVWSGSAGNQFPWPGDMMIWPSRSEVWTCIFNLGSLFSRLSHYIYQWPWFLWQFSFTPDSDRSLMTFQRSECKMFNWDDSDVCLTLILISTICQD